MLSSPLQKKFADPYNKLTYLPKASHRSDKPINRDEEQYISRPRNWPTHSKQGRDEPLKGHQKQSLERETIITLPPDKLTDRFKRKIEGKKMVLKSFELPTLGKIIVKMGPKECVSRQGLLPE